LFAANSETFAVEGKGNKFDASDGVVGLCDSRSEVGEVIKLIPVVVGAGLGQIKRKSPIMP
jgi:hypothetical protein